MLKTHLGALYDTMLEKNLKRLIEPFSQVEISHLAELINLPLPAVEKKLSQMILDDKLKGTLDQGSGNLVVFDEVVEDKLYPAALETIEALGKVVKVCALWDARSSWLLARHGLDADTLLARHAHAWGPLQNLHKRSVKLLA